LQTRAIFLAEFAGGFLEHLSQGSGRVRLADFQRRKVAPEDAKLIDDAGREAAVAEPLADDDRVAPASGHVAREAIANDIDFGPLSIDEECEPRGPARAIAADDDMHPLIHRMGDLRTDRRRIAGPEVDQRP